MRTKTRSAQANRYLFGVVYKEIAKATGRNVNDIHDLCCQWFWPQPKLRKISNWPDGEIRTIVRTVPHTRALSPAQFEEFVTAVRTFARSCLGVTTQDPGYWRFGDKAGEG